MNINMKVCAHVSFVDIILEITKSKYYNTQLPSICNNTMSIKYFLMFLVDIRMQWQMTNKDNNKEVTFQNIF